MIFSRNQSIFLVQAIFDLLQHGYVQAQGPFQCLRDGSSRGVEADHNLTKGLSLAAQFIQGISCVPGMGPYLL